MTRRTKEWWARLSKPERIELVVLEKAAGRGGVGCPYLPDDCSDCACCGNPVLGSGLCSSCMTGLDYLIEKANGEGDD